MDGFTLGTKRYQSQKCKNSSVIKKFSIFQEYYKKLPMPDITLCNMNGIANHPEDMVKYDEYVRAIAKVFHYCKFIRKTCCAKTESGYACRGAQKSN